MLDKYKAQFETKSETNNLKAAESKFITVLKSEIKKAEMSETWWQVKAQKERKKLEELHDLKKKQKTKVKKGGEKHSESKNINDNSTTLDLSADESSKDEERKTATLKAVSVLNDLKS